MHGAHPGLLQAEPCCAESCCAMHSHAVPSHAMPRCAMPSPFLPYHTISYHAKPCHAEPCHATLCHAELCYATPRTVPQPGGSARASIGHPRDCRRARGPHLPFPTSVITSLIPP